ncbi:MAG: hypothetical protein R3F60_03890 [bacterium]
MDEEHDPSFKQHEGCAYHARDMVSAAARGGRGGGAGDGDAVAGEHPQRRPRQAPAARAPRSPGGGAPPRRAAGPAWIHRPPADGAPFLSLPLRDALTETVARGEQAILFLNRRGFSTFVVCEACGHVLQCPECAISLTWHRSRRRLVCHYSDHSQPLPPRCPSCQQAGTIAAGPGTERVEDAVRQLLPTARVERLDRDTAGGRKLEALEQRMRRREIDVLVGTQMVTKGHDFPDVTLVGVLAADASLQFPTGRRAHPSCWCRWLAPAAPRAPAGCSSRPTTLATRCSRPSPPMTTRPSPSRPSTSGASGATPPSPTRSPSGWTAPTRPPWAPPPRPSGATSAAWGPATPCSLHLRGPAPMPIGLLRGRHRWSLLLTATRRDPLHQLAGRLADVPTPGDTRVVLDVDPFDFL